MEESVADTHPMGGFESIMWEMERDPRLASTFSNLSILDRAPDRNLFRRRMQRALKIVPRLRQRVVTSSVPWELPHWVEDPDMDLDHHLRWIDLGGNASRQELNELTATLSRDPLDRERPLWQFIVIEGLADGRAAMLQRLHHTITDGEGGIRLSVEFLDFERTPPEPPEPDPNGAVPTARAARSPKAPRPPKDTERPKDAQGNEPNDKAGPSISAASLVAAGPAAVSNLFGVARSTARQALVGKRRSTIWTERSLGRWFGTTTLSLEDV
ncbi:MAG TPA: wax ester/triacylglycerol synthase domain-containing protein, partial [Microthrixaceae bacterium]|nr:wax ester/triacylglycerol synthase domain-containing protein [Microthrixaceae bacterium]